MPDMLDRVQVDYWFNEPGQRYEFFTRSGYFFTPVSFTQRNEAYERRLGEARLEDGRRAYVLYAGRPEYARGYGQTGHPVWETLSRSISVGETPPTVGEGEVVEGVDRPDQCTWRLDQRRRFCEEFGLTEGNIGYGPRGNDLVYTRRDNGEEFLRFTNYYYRGEGREVRRVPSGTSASRPLSRGVVTPPSEFLPMDPSERVFVPAEMSGSSSPWYPVRHCIIGRPFYAYQALDRNGTALQRQYHLRCCVRREEIAPGTGLAGVRDYVIGGLTGSWYNPSDLPRLQREWLESSRPAYMEAASLVDPEEVPDPEAEMKVRRRKEYQRKFGGLWNPEGNEDWEGVEGRFYLRIAQSDADGRIRVTGSIVDWEGEDVGAPNMFNLCGDRSPLELGYLGLITSFNPEVGFATSNGGRVSVR